LNFLEFQGINRAERFGSGPFLYFESLLPLAFTQGLGGQEGGRLVEIAYPSDIALSMNKIVKAFILTIAGALLVGVLKERPLLLSFILGSVLLVHLVIIGVRHRKWAPVIEETFFLITFGTIGFLTESWGTLNGHWTYHYLPEGQTVPTWVPIAWAIASVLLCKSEDHLMKSQSKLVQGHGLRRRIGLVYLLGMALPLTGESICIAQGVWEYHWPFKVLGVPLLALMLISYAHLVFSLIRSGGARLWRDRQGLDPAHD